MHIATGLMDGQVLQRDKKGLGAAKLEGTAESSGPVELRVEKNGKAVRGFNWVRAGRARGGKWAATLSKLPVGGPYTAHFRVGKESISVKDVLVGDVWVLAGQSNMQGIGNRDEALAPNPLVHVFHMWDAWEVAQDPLHVLSASVDPVHRILMGREKELSDPANRAKEIVRARTVERKGVGPGLPFALEMLSRTGVPQGLVSCAHGGTSMEQWDPGRASESGRSLYGAMLRRVRKLGQPAAGVLWYQGCSDANAAESCRRYTERMQGLVAAVRKDFDQPSLPWLMVQIGRVLQTWDAAGWSSIREQQRRLPDVIPNLSVVPSIDLEMDDWIHVGGRGHRVLGARLARVACHQMKLGGIDAVRLKSIRFHNADVPRQVPPTIEIEFESVAGSLCCGELPFGFSLLDEHGVDLLLIEKTLLDGDRAVLQAKYECNDPAFRSRIRLAYGYGLNPCCNIHDEDGMGLPAFGPVRID